MWGSILFGSRIRLAYYKIRANMPVHNNGKLDAHAYRKSGKEGSCEDSRRSQESSVVSEPVYRETGEIKKQDLQILV